MPKNLWIIFTIYLTLISANSFSTTTKFYEQLTYPDSEWSGHDFGRLPSSSIKKLLQANKPTTYLDKKQCLPMDFYKQYLKFLRVFGKSDTEISRTWLKSHERDLSSKIQAFKASSLYFRKHTSTLRIQLEGKHATCRRYSAKY